MASTVIDPIAQKIVDKLATININAVATKSYKYPPKDLDRLPGAVVELPSIERTPLDQREDHLGSNDWRLTYPVVFYFDLATLATAHDIAVQTIEAWIKAIDADGSLTDTVQEAKAQIDQPEYPPDDEKVRPVMRWRTRLQVLKFVN